jgi:uncharacterized MAPEG superfamily protein
VCVGNTFLTPKSGFSIASHAWLDHARAASALRHAQATSPLKITPRDVAGRVEGARRRARPPQRTVRDTFASSYVFGT